MGARYFIRNIASCLLRASFCAEKITKPFQNFVLINRYLTASSVGINESVNRLVVKWQDDNNLSDEYPLTWLRDNCQCPSCFDLSSQSRTINFSRFQLNQKCSSKVGWHDIYAYAFYYNLFE